MATITTELFETADDLAAAMGAAARGCDAVALFALGIAPASLEPFAESVPSATPVFFADCYGILGYSAQAGRNLELMEKGRGQEYGGVGGRGGEGVVAVIFAEGFAGSTNELPADATAHMSVATHGSDINSFLRANATAPYYGGVAKATYRYAQQGGWQEVPYFFVSANAPTGTTSFTSHASDSVAELLEQIPAGHEAETIALFPCFMRGINEYGEDNVESAAIAGLLPGKRVYGMFCHGELGPRRCLGFATVAAPQEACGQHSMTSIVAVHASRA